MLKCFELAWAIYIIYVNSMSALLIQTNWTNMSLLVVSPKARRRAVVTCAVNVGQARRRPTLPGVVRGVTSLVIMSTSAHPRD